MARSLVHDSRAARQARRHGEPGVKPAAFLAAMVVLAVVSALAFAWLTEEVLHHAFDAFNRGVLLQLNTLVSPHWTTLAKALSTVGSNPGIALVAVALGGWLWQQGRRVDTYTLAAVVGGGAVLTFLFKQLFKEGRPQVVPHLVPEHTFAFPSGHATMSACLYGFIAVWLIAEGPREAWRYLVALLAIALAFAIGMSRLYLGVHYPTDVAAGFALAAFWVTACWAAHARWARAALRRGERG